MDSDALPSSSFSFPSFLTGENHCTHAQIVVESVEEHIQTIDRVQLIIDRFVFNDQEHFARPLLTDKQVINQ